jgi:hypothetical protein
MVAFAGSLWSREYMPLLAVTFDDDAGQAPRLLDEELVTFGAPREPSLQTIHQCPFQSSIFPAYAMSVRSREHLFRERPLQR